MSAPGEQPPEEIVAVPVHFLLGLEEQLRGLEEITPAATPVRQPLTAFLGAAGIDRQPAAEFRKGTEITDVTDVSRMIEQTLAQMIDTAPDSTAAAEIRQAEKEGYASEALTQTFLTKLVAPYAAILDSAFGEHRTMTKAERTAAEPPLPNHQNVDAWKSHLKEYGRDLTWTEHAKFGMHYISAHYLPRSQQLVQFEITTETDHKQQQKESTVVFTLDQTDDEQPRIVAVAVQKTSTHKTTDWHRDDIQTSIFELDLEPTMIVRRNYELTPHIKTPVETLHFDAQHKGFRQSHDDPAHRLETLGFRQVGQELLEALSGLPWQP